jgi:hypothetical protein
MPSAMDCERDKWGVAMMVKIAAEKTRVWRIIWFFAPIVELSRRRKMDGANRHRFLIRHNPATCRADVAPE